MDLEAHWTAFYTAMRAALDAAGHTTVPVVHVFSGDGGPNTASATPPFVAYSQQSGRFTGTTGGGSLKVINDRWQVTAYAVSLADALALVSVIADDLTDAVLVTADGYTTTDLSPTSTQSIWEPDSRFFAFHCWMQWERSL